MIYLFKEFLSFVLVFRVSIGSDLIIVLFGGVEDVKNIVLKYEYVIKVK